MTAVDEPAPPGKAAAAAAPIGRARTPLAVAGVLVALVWARVRHARTRWLAVVSALGLALALPVTGAAVRLVTTDAALRRGIAELEPGGRSVTVSYTDPSTDTDRTPFAKAALTALARLGDGPVRAQVSYRAVTDARGGSFVLAGTDGLADAVTLIGGRLPGACRPERCEVVEVTAGAVPIDRAGVERTFGIVVVGTATRRDPLLVAGTFDPGREPALLVGDGVAEVANLASLAHFARAYGWVEPLDLRRVRRVGVAGWAGASIAASDDLLTASRFLSMTVPVDELRREDARASVSSRRFGLLVGSTGVLLLGVAVVGGAALRRDHEAFVGALRRRGAGRGQLAVVVGGEVIAAAVAALALGLAGAWAVAMVLARRGALPAGGLARQALSAGVTPTVVGAAAAALLVAATLTVPADPRGTRSTWRVVEAAAVTLAAVAVLLASRGGVGAATGDRGGVDDTLLPALPALWTAAAALALARLWPWLVALAGRVVPRRAVGPRLGLAAAAGRPLRPAATAALLTAAVAGAVFAGAYRATLARGAADQAAYAVPTDARVVGGPALVRPLDALTADVLAPRGLTGHPVLRVAASLRVSPQQGTLVQLVGVDRAVLPAMRRWQATVGGGDPEAVAAAIAVGDLATGTMLPAGRRLRIASDGPRITLAVDASVRAPDGRVGHVQMAVDGSGHDQSLVGQIPDLGPGPLALVGLGIRQAPDDATRRTHALGESNVDKERPTGEIAFGAVTVDDRAVATPWRGWGGSTLVVEAGGASATLPYELATTAMVLSGRPDGPGTSTPLPMAVDPQTAATARDGQVTIVVDQHSVTGRVVAVLDRFPTVDPGARFAVVDVDALGRVADLTTPGAGQPEELWLTADAPATAPTAAATATAATAAGSATAAGAALAERLDGGPFAAMRVTVRAAAEHRLRSDPVARAAIAWLLAAVGLTALVAAVALVLLVHTEQLDDAGQLYAWEADGVAPRVLRASLWWRAAAVALPAMPVGVGTGVALSRLTARLVAVTATATAPAPPLVPGVGVGAALAVAVAAAVVVLVAARGVAALALREPLPVGPRGGVSS